MKEVRLVFPDVIVVRVDSDEDKRFGRKDRSENISREQFYDRDENDLYDGGLSRVFDSADYVIENNSGIAPFYGKIEEFLSKKGLID
jgi:dephospho-CoA kinase